MKINTLLLNELRTTFLRFILVLLFIILAVTAEALAPWPFKLLIDNVLGKESLDTNTIAGKIFSIFTSRESLALATVFAFFAATLLGSVMEYFVTIATKDLAKNIIFSFSKKVFVNLERIAIGHLKKQQIGDYIYRLSYDVWALGDLFENGLVPAITNALYLLTTTIILFFISPHLAMLALGMIPILAIGLTVFNKKIGIETKRSERANSTFFSFIEEVLTQLRTIQAYNQEQRESVLFDKKEGTSLVKDLHVYGLGLLLNLLIGVIIAVGYSVVILLGIREVFADEISTGLLVVFMFYLDNLTNPLLTFLSSLSILRENYIKVSRMHEFFDKKSQTEDKGIKTALPSSRIVFTNVSVYGEENHPILEDVSLEIPENKKTILVGVSGSGKTTIASLILRFADPSTGIITIGGIAVNDYLLRTLREAITYVPQEIVLFDDTIYNNIAFGNPGSSIEEIREAVKLADAETFIKTLPGGYQYKVGDEGVNLSGGQRQRIMLARAFLKKQAHIAIFDEPFSSLDLETRTKVMESIDKFSRGKTIIIISNVADVIKSADHIIVINEGKVAHTGGSISLLKTLV